MEDESQLLYYEDRIKKMPLPVLRKHRIITSDRSVVSLNAGKLSYEERAAIRDRGRKASPPGVVQG
jgi:hypothetical protein